MTFQEMQTMTHPAVSINLMDASFNLLNFDDLAVFNREEQGLYRQADNYPRRQQSVARTNLIELAQQAAWLTIEKVFHDLPTLESICLSVDDDDTDSYMLVEFQHQGEDCQGAGEDESGEDENLQQYLNDMGRNQHVDFFSILKSLSVERNTLADCAQKLLGIEWVTDARAGRLEKTLPQPSQENRPGPRM